MNPVTLLGVSEIVIHIVDRGNSTFKIYIVKISL